MGQNLLDVGRENLSGVLDFMMSAFQPGPGSPLAGTAFDNLITQSREKLPQGSPAVQVAGLFTPGAPKFGKASQIARSLKAFSRRGNTAAESLMAVFPRALKNKKTGEILTQAKSNDLHFDIANRALGRTTDIGSEEMGKLFTTGNVDARSGKFIERFTEESDAITAATDSAIQDIFSRGGY